MSWPWSESHVPRVARSGRRRNAASRRRPTGIARTRRRLRLAAVTPRHRRGRPPGLAGLAGAGASGSRGSSTGGPSRARPLTISSAPGGSSASGRPAAMSYAAADVDRVVALVHARRLQDVRRVPERRVGEHVAEAGDADPAGTEVLVAIDPRAELGLRVVEVDHDQPVEPDPSVEVGQEGVHCRRIADIDPGRPRVRDVEAEADPVGGQVAPGRCLGDGGQLRHVHAEPEAAPGRVLEHDPGGGFAAVARAIDLGEDQRKAVGEPLDAGRRPRCRGAIRCGR